jgi:hypothetical protein
MATPIRKRLYQTGSVEMGRTSVSWKIVARICRIEHPKAMRRSQNSQWLLLS